MKNVSSKRNKYHVVVRRDLKQSLGLLVELPKRIGLSKSEYDLN